MNDDLSLHFHSSRLLVRPLLASDFLDLYEFMKDDRVAPHAGGTVDESIEETVHNLHHLQHHTNAPSRLAQSVFINPYINTTNMPIFAIVAKAGNLDASGKMLEQDKMIGTITPTDSFSLSSSLLDWNQICGKLPQPLDSAHGPANIEPSFSDQHPSFPSLNVACTSPGNVLAHISTVTSPEYEQNELCFADAPTAQRSSFVDSIYDLPESRPGSSDTSIDDLMASSWAQLPVFNGLNFHQQHIANEVCQFSPAFNSYSPGLVSSLNQIIDLDGYAPTSSPEQEQGLDQPASSLLINNGICDVSYSCIEQPAPAQFLPYWIDALEIGFALHPDFWGLGIVHEAVQTLLYSYIYRLPFCPKVILIPTFAYNSQSIRVIEKLGGVPIDTFVQAQLRPSDGTMQDTILFALFPPVTFADTAPSINPHTTAAASPPLLDAITIDHTCKADPFGVGFGLGLELNSPKTTLTSLKQKPVLPKLSSGSFHHFIP